MASAAVKGFGTAKASAVAGGSHHLLFFCAAVGIVNVVVNIN
jgi:hypothetical protein